jgi:hypothetical protein
MASSNIRIQWPLHLPRLKKRNTKNQEAPRAVRSSLPGVPTYPFPRISKLSDPLGKTQTNVGIMSRC